MKYKKTVFVFAGIGSQWRTMGRGLSEYPVFMEMLEACDRCFHAYSGWSVTEELQREKEVSRIHEAVIAPACICAVEIALAELLKSWGIQPDAVIGHSIGEAVAAYTAGVISLSDVFKIIFYHSVTVHKSAWAGTMAHVSLSADKIGQLLRQYPDLSVAAYNGPCAAVISGEKEKITEIADKLTREQIFCKILNITVPFHTPAIEPYKEYVFQKLGPCVRLSPMTIPIYSTLHGRIGSASDYDARYWTDHIRKPVRFAEGIDAVLSDGYRHFIEISPHSILLGNIREISDHVGNLSKTSFQLVLIPTLKRGSDEKTALLETAARLVSSGYSMPSEQFQPEDKACVCRLSALYDQEQQKIDSETEFFEKTQFLQSIDEKDGNERRNCLTEVVRSAIRNASGQRMFPPADEHANFFDMGMDSLTAFRLWNLLCSRLNISPPLTLIFEYPAMQKLVAHLLTWVQEIPSENSETERTLSDDTEGFELVDFIETRNNPLFEKLSGFNLCVSHQKNRELEIDGRKFIDFASCNYLGLDYHPQVMEAIPRLIEKWGVHPSWTRLVASPAPYFELEERLAEFVKAPAALVFPCIAMLNFGVLPILAGPGGVILCDSAAHHTIQEACQLAYAKGITCAHFRYNDLDDLERQLKRYSHKSPVIIAVDGVYSMTAKYVDLPGYSRLAKKYNAYLFVDDAHGFGIIGENPTKDQPYGYKGNGIVNYFGMDYVDDRVIYVTGMSKAFASFAAFIVCLNPEMKEKLRLASTYIFSGPIPVASLASSLAGLEVNEKEGDQLRHRLYSLSERLASGARTLGFEVDNFGSFPIVYVVTGNPEPTVQALNIAWERGLIVSPGIFPAVPLNHGGLRFSITALNTEAEIDQTLEILEEIRDKCMTEESLKRYAN